MPTQLERVVCETCASPVNNLHFYLCTLCLGSNTRLCLDVSRAFLNYGSKFFNRLVASSTCLEVVLLFQSLITSNQPKQSYHIHRRFCNFVTCALCLNISYGCCELVLLYKFLLFTCSQCYNIQLQFEFPRITECIRSSVELLDLTH